MDSEAKLFEYAADIAKDGKEHTINMLSEKCMCDSCLGVMKQFKEKYPNVTVNVVSNKKERNEKTRASLGKIGSDNNESRPRFGI